MAFLPPAFQAEPLPFRSPLLWRMMEVSIPKPFGPNRFRTGAGPRPVHHPLAVGAGFEPARPRGLTRFQNGLFAIQMPTAP